MNEIAKPVRQTWWIARSVDGSVLHCGSNASDEVTTTGQPVFETYEDVGEFLEALEAFADKFPPPPDEREDITEGDIVNISGELALCRLLHKRGGGLDLSKFFTKAQKGRAIPFLRGERLVPGSIRRKDTEDWRCKERHVTEENEDPDRSPKFERAT